MPKQDKFPDLNPCERGIFERIVAAATELRKHRLTTEGQEAQRRREEAEAHMRKVREREAKAEEAERLEQERRLTTGVPLLGPSLARPSEATLKLRAIRTGLPAACAEYLPKSLDDTSPPAQATHPPADSVKDGA